MRGLFITFEGMDASGKSTQAQMLADALKERGYDVLSTREPGGCSISESIRGIILDPLNREMEPVTETLLYAASRAQLVREIIEPALSSGKIVLCDRYIHSSIAYQGYGRELGRDAVMQINYQATEGIMPHMTFFLMCPLEMTYGRMGDEKDRIELMDEGFHKRVHEGFMELSRGENCTLVDAWGSIEEIHEDILRRALRLIDARERGIC